MDEFELGLQSENAHFGSESAIFCPQLHFFSTFVTVRKRPIGSESMFLSRVTLKFDRWLWHLFYATSSFVYHFSYWWIQIRVTVRKPPILVKLDDFLAVWPWNLTLKNNRAPSFPKQHQALCIISSSYMNSSWSYGPETVFYLCDLDIWPLTLTFCKNLTSVICNNSWKFHDDTMMGT